MVIGRIQDQKQEHNLEWSYVGFRTAIPTLVFNFVQLFFMLVIIGIPEGWSLVSKRAVSHE